MAEVVFPLAAIAGTFFILIPLLTLLSRAVLGAKRRRTRSWPSFGSESTFAWLVAPTLVPLLWLVSAAYHQNEGARMSDTCLVEHGQSATCLDAVLLLGALLLGGLTFLARRAWRERLRVAPASIDGDHPLATRVARVVASDPRLRRLRIAVVRRSPSPVFSSGWLRRRVFLDACFVRDADDDMVRAALLHEHAHIAGHDTLRAFLARVCLSANPLGGLLRPDYEHWRRAREAQCDAHAVHLGGDKLALAEGIVLAARFRCLATCPCPAALSPLCGHDAAALRLRLSLLLGDTPAPARTVGHLALAILLVGVIALPHFSGLGALDHFHFEVERLLHSLR